MAYPAGNGGLRSPREDSFAFRNSVGSQMGSSNDVRGQLHRRFTTNNIPTVSTPLSPIGQQRRQAAEPTEFTTAVRTIRSHNAVGRVGSNPREHSSTLAMLHWSFYHRLLQLLNFLFSCMRKCGLVVMFPWCRAIRGESELGLTDQSTRRTTNSKW